MRIAIIYGGKSNEHEVSIRSVSNIFNIVNSLGYEPILIGISKDGKSYLQPSNILKLSSLNIVKTKISLAFSPGEGIINHFGENLNIHCAIPLIHGAFGEDGSLQGALQLSGTPYVGENVSTSAICFDKTISNVILEHANIPIVPYIILLPNEPYPKFVNLIKFLGKKIIVKPAKSGSSIGVSYVDTPENLKIALDLAFKHDNKVLIEKYIKGREINCAFASHPFIIGELGEILGIKESIYSFNEKYVNNSTILEIPAKLSKELTKKIKLIALNSYKALNCKSMARIDLFLTDNMNIYVNEINTIPAFSKNSIYPKLIESIGISQKSLVMNLITQAIN